ncbi:HAMP domain-containing sensor histidine kinase [Bacteroides sp. 224]|uniref:sensor histidine kinase n=1 Tax=Bacteroides sp. 224 TaxID=2302936 RepID=UPI0013D4C6E7|nr:HAMP domain-containing sensor histidine kinase [Bacteroides sp. 224]NDV64037.1 sensor histidine kinase [Bacteroides sp. 224]
MKKVLLILICVLCYHVAQAQINATTKVTETELNNLRNEFQELFKQKDYQNAVEKGAKLGELLVEEQKNKEAAPIFYQMDQLVYESEKKTGKTNFRLRFLIANQRLRMYTREGKSESSKTQYNLMQYCMSYLKNDNSLMDDMLLSEAEYYYTFGQTAKSLESYKELLQRCLSGNKEESRESCYKDMLAYADRKNMAPLTKSVQTLYTAWQDSINMVKAARELESLKQQHVVLQQDLQEKEQTISTNKAVTIGLWTVIIALAAIAGILLLLLFKSIYQARKLKNSLKIANESNAQKSHFISNINTQITPTLEVMENAVGNPGFTDIIQKSIVALKGRIANMQTYISLEESREEAYPINNLDVKLLCETVMQKASANFNPGVESVTTVPRVTVKTNTEALEHILTYLLARAASNTEAGRISLEFKKRNARTGQFIITDTGTIIESEIQEELFKPFMETDPLAKEDGWGLPICQLMAYKLNGTLKIDTEYKKGIRFILDLCS